MFKLFELDSFDDNDLKSNKGVLPPDKAIEPSRCFLIIWFDKLSDTSSIVLKYILYIHDYNSQISPSLTRLLQGYTPCHFHF